MLSEREISRGFRPFWEAWAPGLTIKLIRGLARSDGSLVKFCHTWDTCFASTAPSRHNDVIGEMAFGLFAHAIEVGTAPIVVERSDTELIFQQAAARIAVLRGRHEVDSELITEAHRTDATMIACRLYDYCRRKSGIPNIQPRLLGLGIVRACHPDIMQGLELIEVKTSKSVFRASDLRQLLVYAALAWAHSPSAVETVSLVNPRLGLTWRFSTDDLAHLLSGQKADIFFREFAHLLDFD
jgi:hypothetical protein